MMPIKTRSISELLPQSNRIETEEEAVRAHPLRRGGNRTVKQMVAALVLDESKRPANELQLTTDEAKLNKLERAWLDVLRARHAASVVADIGIQDMTLKLADGVRYTPDFRVWNDFGLVFYEVKGFMRDDARCKLLMAARTFRRARFVMVTRERGTWQEIEVKP